MTTPAPSAGPSAEVPDPQRRWTIEITTNHDTDLREAINDAVRGLVADLAEQGVAADVAAFNAEGDAFNDWATG